MKVMCPAVTFDVRLTHCWQASGMSHISRRYDMKPREDLHVPEQGSR
jgi:hypothetical protein